LPSFHGLNPIAALPRRTSLVWTVKLIFPSARARSVS
jgi:hypothetical protein